MKDFAPKLPAEQEAIRAICFHPSGSFIKFEQEEMEQSIAHRFEKQVRAFPRRLAVKDDVVSVTYEELNRAANRIAHAILARLGRGEEPVALLMDHGAAVIAAILGVLKAGKIYVPLDSSNPSERIGAMLEDSQAQLLLTDDRTDSLVGALGRGAGNIMNIDHLEPGISEENPGLPRSAEGNAYIMYTSGSTGEPKGVIHSQPAVLHRMMTHTNDFHISVEDRLALLQSPSFSQSIRVIFGALLNGAGLFLFDIHSKGLDALVDWLVRERITLYFSVSTIFRHFVGNLDGRGNLPDLRLIYLGGETVTKDDVELYQKNFSPDCILLNSLSANECGPIAQYFIDKTTKVGTDVVPVGYSLPGRQVLILNDRGEIAPCGESGQIVIKSSYLSPGYWRRPDLTKVSFIEDPDGGPERAYLTGDLGVMLRDGCLVYIGRKDFQVKVRGHRTDLGAIEKVLLTHDKVKEVVVLGQDDGRGDMGLTGYVVPTCQSPLDINELRAFLREKLPDYMVPSAFVVLESLPLTSNGKIDRRALPAPRRERSDSVEYLPPVETVEHQLVAIWEEILDVRPIGLRDNFFELGGHSLLAAKMVQRTEEVCGEKVPLSTLLAAPTIEELASLLVRQRLGEQGSLLVKVQSGGIKPPIFFLHGDFRGGGYYCLNLARGLGEDQPFYALTPFGLDGRPSPSTVEEMAASYISMIRAVEPRGPYVLGGLCNGGIVAFEMARQLQESGKKVVLVALVGARVRNPSVARYFQKVVFNLGHLLGLPSERRTDLFLFWRERVLELCRHYRYAVRRLRKVSESPFGAKLLWLVRQAKKTARNVGRGLRPGVWRKGPGQTRSIDGPPKFDVDKFYRRVLANYIPGRYSGRAVLLWPEEVPVNSEPDQRILKWEQAVDPTLGWGKLAREVEAHKIPGGWTTSLTTHVADLSERLKACIHEALAKEREQERASHGLVTPMERYNSSERPDASW